jgi:hypothetical protein
VKDLAKVIWIAVWIVWAILLTALMIRQCWCI